MDLDLQLEQAGDRTIVAVSGDLDVLSATRLRQLLDELIARGDTNLLLDLRLTEFVDSSGLSALVSGMKGARAAGGDLALICGEGNVRRLIEMVALDQVFTLHDDVPPAPGPPPATGA